MTTAPNVTDAMRQAARGKIRHAAECHPTAANYVETRGARGDALLRCTSCRRFYVVAPAPRVATPRPVAAPVAPVVPTPAPTPAPVPLVTRWRCGNHPENVTTWRGTGCPDCTAEHDARQRAREHAARERRERAERGRLR